MISLKTNVTGKTTFYDFFKKFASDSCFQRKHILFPLKIIYEGYDYEETLRHFALQIGSEKLKFSTPNKSFINGLTNFALAG